MDRFADIRTRFRSAFPDLLAKSTTLRAAKHNLDVDDDADDDDDDDGEASEELEEAQNDDSAAFSAWLETGNLRRLEDAFRACGIVSAAQLKTLSLEDLRLLRDADGAKLLAVGPLSRLRRMLAGDDADATANDAPAADDASTAGASTAANGSMAVLELQTLLMSGGLESLLPALFEAGISSVPALLQREQDLAELRGADGSRAVESCVLFGETRQ
jgi:hypothetical protein